MRTNSESTSCDIEQVLELHGCREAYERLEACLGEHDRDWSACQEPLKLLRDCYENSRQGAAGQRSSALADSTTKAKPRS